MDLGIFREMETGRRQWIWPAFQEAPQSGTLSPAVSHWAGLYGDHVCSHHLEDQCLQRSPFSEIADSQQVGNSQGSTLAPSNFQLFEKFALRIETSLFSSQSMCIFSGFKDAPKKMSSFSLTDDMLCSLGCWSANRNRRFFLFIPPRYPNVPFRSLSKWSPQWDIARWKGWWSNSPSVSLSRI